MPTNLNTILFPYTEIKTSLADKLFKLIGHISVYQPVGTYTDDASVLMPNHKALTFLRPDTGRLDTNLVDAAMAEFRGWADNARDIKDVAHLRGLAGEFESNEGRTTALMSTIRSYGQQADEHLLADHVFLRLASEYDHNRNELNHLVSEVRNMEAGLGQAVGLKREDPDNETEVVNQAIDPLAIPDLTFDPLLGLRLKSWSRLYNSLPTPTNLFLTGPAVITHLLSIIEEAGQDVPKPVASFDLDNVQAEEVTKVLAMEEQTDEDIVFDRHDNQLKLWRFPGVLVSRILGLGLGSDPWVTIMEVDPVAGQLTTDETVEINTHGSKLIVGGCHNMEPWPECGCDYF